MNSESQATCWSSPGLDLQGREACGNEVVQMTRDFSVVTCFQDGAFKQQGVAWRGCVAKIFVDAVTQAGCCSELCWLFKLAIWLPLVGCANQLCNAFYSPGMWPKGRADSLRLKISVSNLEMHTDPTKVEH